MIERDHDASDNPLPDVGARVDCLRRSDDRRIVGVIEENRAGLFLLCDDGSRHVLTSSLWDVLQVGDPSKSRLTAADMRGGFYPGITGGMDTEDYLAETRGEQP